MSYPSFSTRRLELIGAVCLALLVIALGTSGFVHLTKDLGKQYGGFLWGLSYHGGVSGETVYDGGFIHLSTPSSSEVLDLNLHWNDGCTSIDSRPVTEAGEIFAGKEPGDLVRYDFKIENTWESLTEEKLVPVQEFTLDRLIESAGVYYIGGLVFAACGVVLVGFTPRPGTRLAANAGWLLLLTAAYVEVGLRTTFASSMREHSLLADLTWHISFACAGTVLILLAAELALGVRALKVIRRLTPVLFVLSVGIAAYGLLYYFVDYGLGLWWLGEAVYACLGGIALLIATGVSISRLPTLRRKERREYRSLVSLPFAAGVSLIFLIAIFPGMAGGTSLLPSQLVIPLVTAIPVGLVYSVIAARGMEDRDAEAQLARAEAARANSAALAFEVAMLRYRAEVAGFKGYLHDEILRELQAITWQLESLQQNSSLSTSHIHKGLQAAVGSIREALSKVTSDQPMGDDFPSLQDLEKLARETTNLSRVDIRIEPSLYTCSEYTRKLLYIHLHTMLINSYEHGKSSSISVSLDRQDDWAILTVTDDGIGFDISILQGTKPPSSAGLLEAIAIAQACGGTIEVESSPGQGTRIVERLPATVSSAPLDGGEASF